MGYDISDVELVGKICTVAKVFDPHLSVFYRDKSKGELSVVKVPWPQVRSIRTRMRKR